MNIVIAGSRDFTDYETLKREADRFIKALKPTTPVKIVCGMARGADLLGKKYAEEKGYEVIEMPADWDKHGRKAGPLRNQEMCDIADATLAFWNGESKGTSHMINISLKKRITVAVIDV